MAGVISIEFLFSFFSVASFPAPFFLCKASLLRTPLPHPKKLPFFIQDDKKFSGDEIKIRGKEEEEEYWESVCFPSGLASILILIFWLLAQVLKVTSTTFLLIWEKNMYFYTSF